jgi:hypothetical protein
MSLRRYIDRMVRETVVVHMTSGPSVRGVLLAVHRDCLVLIHARFLSGSESVDIAGEAVVPRERVAWLQHLAGEREVDAS